MRRRQGFALLVVLWSLVGAALLVALLDSLGRDGLALARNRAAMARSRWTAEACVARVRGEIDARLADRETRMARWLDLDAVTAPALATLPCSAHLRSAGTRRNVNALDEAALHRILAAAGVPATVADSITDAIMDWRDGDASPRPAGAERDWYLANGLPTPRDGDIRSREELALVRGLAGHPEVQALLGVDHERTVLGRAPLAVIAEIPGMNDESLRRLAEMRAANVEPTDLGALMAVVSPATRAALMANPVETAGFVSNQPDAWYLTVDRAEGAGLPTMHVEVRLVLMGGRVAIGRWHSWT